MANQNPYSKRRLDFVDQSIKELASQAKQLQRSFWESFLENVMLSLSAKGKKIENTDENLRIINSLAQIIDGDIRPGDGQDFLEWYVSQLDELSGLNQKYFGDSDTVKRFANENRDRLLKLLGYSNGKIKNGSFLYTLIDFGDVYNQLQQNLIGTIYTGQPFDVAGTKDFIVGKVGKKGDPLAPSGGIIEKELNAKTFDSFQQYDRLIQKGVAEDLDLKYAIYQGGLIATSRDFCDVRNDKVFSRDEIAKFGTPTDQYAGYTDKSKGEFDGKTNPYNPFVDLGGHQCRHHLDWISTELAEELLKDEANKARIGAIVTVKLDEKNKKPPKPKKPKNEKSKDPKFTPKKIDDYEQALGINVDRSIFGLLKERVKFTGKDMQGAYFNPRTKKVNIPIQQRRLNSKWGAEAVVYHEFGHAIDNQRKYFTSNEIKDLMDKHNKGVGYWDQYEKLMKLSGWAYKRKWFDVAEQTAALLDTIESLTTSLQGNYHDLYYWRRPGNPEKEFIAHLFENKFKGNKFAKRYFPDLYQDMLDFKLE